MRGALRLATRTAAFGVSGGTKTCTLVYDEDLAALAGVAVAVAVLLDGEVAGHDRPDAMTVALAANNRGLAGDARLVKALTVSS
jgi:hypothetical protein